MQIKLKDYTVELKDEITWGDSQRLEEAIFSSAKLKSGTSGNMDFDFDASSLSKSKYIAMECVVLSIKKGEESVPYSKDWVDNLSLSDGTKLYQAVEEVTKKK